MLKNLKNKNIYEMAENENIDGVPFYMKIDEEYKKGDVFYWNNHYMPKLNGQYRILDKYNDEMYIVEKLP